MIQIPRLNIPEAKMTTVLDNKVYVDGELFCTVEKNILDNAADPEALMDWMMAMVDEWVENVEKQNTC
jgi:hypothetical protein